MTSVFAGTSSRTTRFLGGIERIGNKLPHPFYLFLILAGLVVVVSAVMSMTGATTSDPRSGEEVAVRSLLSREGLIYALTSAIENFVTFPPLGLIITVMLGIGIAERTGLLTSFMKGVVQSAPKWAVTFVVVVISMMGNLASDSAAVILPPLAAVAFIVAGRHPLAGFVASYVAVIAGFSANIIPAGTDVLLSGITTSAAQSASDSVTVTPLSNWYFMSVSTVLLAVTITVVCQRFVEPRLGTYEGSHPEDVESLNAGQRRGLRFAALALAIYLVVVAATVTFPASPLRGKGGAVLQSPFMDSLPIIILGFFLVGGLVYGRTAGTLTTAQQVPEMMAESVKELVPFIIVIFTAAQAIAWFGWTNLGALVATSGAEVLESTGLNGIWGLVIFSLAVTIPALILASGSSLWVLLAPMFVPMFMLAGVDPAYVQAAFRITDSATNAFVPLNPMLPVILGLMQKYSPKAGLGTLFSLVAPFTFALWAVWLLLFLVWGIADLPVGPGHSLRLDQP